MHLRRALLLFAIVLGLAALVGALSRGGEDKPAGRPPEPRAVPQGGPAVSGPATLRFRASGAPDIRKLRARRPAVLIVSVDQAGQVEVRGLGLSAPAEPQTPARFDVFQTEPGRFPVVFMPVRHGKPRRVGILAVED